MNDSKKIINKIITEPIAVKNYKEAKETLQNCGILDENGDISVAYKDIIIKNTNESNPILSSVPKTISVVTIANLISAHLEGDKEKFLSYANLIANTYENANEIRSAEIIRRRINGNYKNDPKIVLD